MELNTLRELFEDQLRDLYSAEQQIIAVLPRMSQAASNEALKAGFEQHLKETQQQARRLEQIADALGITIRGKNCDGIEGLLKEEQEVLKQGGNPAVRDAALIACAQRIEHYEIAGYGTARTFAEQLGFDEAVELLEETLEEEANTNELLTQIAEEEVNIEAAESEEDFDDDISATEEEAVRR